MGVRIIVGTEAGTDTEHAVLFCSTSMRALPWLFDSAEDAEAFLELATPIYGDVRELSAEEGERVFTQFQETRAAGRDVAPRGGGRLDFVNHRGE